eukprot:4616266-Pyramimonas_sp.AAC.1
MPGPRPERRFAICPPRLHSVHLLQNCNLTDAPPVECPPRSQDNPAPAGLPGPSTASERAQATAPPLGLGRAQEGPAQDGGAVGGGGAAD